MGVWEGLLMPSPYNRLRTGTVPRLLSKYKTGTVEIGRPVTVAGANPWDPPTTTTTWTEIDAVVTGVSQKYVDGQNIVMFDRMVNCQAPVNFDEAAGDLLRIDGKVVAILSMPNVLAAGDVVLNKFIVRG